MNKDKKFVCENCNKVFQVKYHISKTQKPRFCCKGCAQKPKYNAKHQLVSDVKALIKAKGRYTSVKEVLKGLKINSRVLNKFDVSITAINKSLNFKRPSNFMQLLVETHLKSLGLEFESEKTFFNFKPYRFDIFISDLNLLIELDDESHWNPTHRFFNQNTMYRDYLKNEFADTSKIKLVRIRFSRVSKDLEFVLSSIDDVLIGLGYLNGDNAQTVLNQQPDYRETD